MSPFSPGGLRPLRGGRGPARKRAKASRADLTLSCWCARILVLTTRKDNNMGITYAWNYDPDAEREAAAEERAWAEAEAEDYADRVRHAAMYPDG